MQDFLFRKWYLPSIKEELAKITLDIEILDNAQVTGIIDKIVYYFNYKWVRVFFHQSDLFNYSVLIFLLKKVKWHIRPFKS